MTTSKSLADRLREVFLNGKWIANTNYKAQLEHVNWQQAMQRVENLNSIAILTYHVNYYLAGLIQVFQGGALEIRDKYSFDLPPIESAAGWQRLVQEFLSNAEAFAQQVEQMDEAQLSAPFVEEKYGSYLRNIEGILEHSYYHLGQIVLLNKMISGTER